MNQKIIKYPIIFTFILGSFLYGCSNNNTQSPNISGNKKIITDSVEVNISPFIDAGCVKDEYSWRFKCKDAKTKELHKCKKYYYNKGLVGFNVPILECIYPEGISIYNGSSDEYVRNVGIDHIAGLQYVVYIDGRFDYIINKDALKKFAVPINDTFKAFSYVSAMTGSYPKFRMSKEWIEISKAVDSFVITKNDGYEVRLYNSQGGICCGTDYIIYAIDYKVTNDGEISQISRTKIGTVYNRAIA